RLRLDVGRGGIEGAARQQRAKLLHDVLDLCQRLIADLQPRTNGIDGVDEVLLAGRPGTEIDEAVCLRGALIVGLRRAPGRNLRSEIGEVALVLLRIEQDQGVFGGGGDAGHDAVLHAYVWICSKVLKRLFTVWTTRAEAE